MRLTLKKENAGPAKANFLQQHAVFDDFVEEVNLERPLEALDMNTPAQVYKPASRDYRGIGKLEHIFHDRTAIVTNCGRICLYNKKINVSHVFSVQALRHKEVEENTWLVSFMDYDLGYIDLEE